MKDCTVRSNVDLMYDTSLWSPASQSSDHRNVLDPVCQTANPQTCVRRRKPKHKLTSSHIQPLDPKPMKMKVLGPQYMGYNP